MYKLVDHLADETCNLRQLVLNNFGGEEKHKKLLVTVFQNLFPPIHVQSMKLSQARRVVLLSYNSQSDTIEWRHFLISVRPVGVSSRVRRVIEGTNKPGAGVANSNNSKNDAFASSTKGKGKGKSLPNLGNVGDISEYVLGRKSREGSIGAGSDTDLSEAESELDDVQDPNNTVELFQRYVGRGNDANEQRAVRLREVGPRMELKLIKIEDGMAGGETLYHQRIQKSAKEQAQTRKLQAEKVKVRNERKAKQEENVKRKQQEKEARKGKTQSDPTAEDDDDAADEEDADADADDDEDEFEYEDRFAARDQDGSGDEGDLFDDFGADDDDVSLDEGGSDEEEEDEDEDSEGEDATSHMKKRRS